MKKTTNHNQIFYYSRRKLVLYLLFNLILLTLALFFSWVIFPQYSLIYSFAIGACLLSVAAALAVNIIRHPLAMVNKDAIKIDFCEPLKWKNIKSYQKVSVGYRYFHREIIVLKIKDMAKCHLTLMQKLIKNSEYSAFSIPLYAMERCDADAIEEMLEKHIK